MASLLETPMQNRFTSSFPDELDILSAFGLEVQPDFDDILAIYDASGFLYPQKVESLAPFWPKIGQLWNRLKRSKPPLLMVGIERRHKKSTGTIWKSSNNTWFIQHLASRGDPFGTATLVMGTIAALYLPSEVLGFQVWFRSDNKLPNRLFGAAFFDGDEENQDYALRTYNYCKVLKAELKYTLSKGFDVIRCDDTTAPIASSLITQLRGSVFVDVEELRSDPFLAGIDSQFQCEGLRRYRRIYLALKGSAVVGCAIAFRGPLGLNFSFLENRCDLVLKQGLGSYEAAAIIEALLTEAANAYADFEPEWIPVTTESALADLPAIVRPMRVYTQAIYLRPAMPRFYDGLRSIYARLLTRQMRLQGHGVSTVEKDRAREIS
jgi:hypothetical protein